MITNPPLGGRAAAFKYELENHGVTVEGLPKDWAGGPLWPRWIADLESRWDAAVVVPNGGDGDMILSTSSVMFGAYTDARNVHDGLLRQVNRQATVGHGRPRLFLSLVDGTQLNWLYSLGMPTLLPETPQEVVPLLITAMKTTS